MTSAARRRHGPIWCRLFHRPIECDIQMDEEPYFTFGCGPLYDVDLKFTCRYDYSWIGL